MPILKLKEFFTNIINSLEIEYNNNNDNYRLKHMIQSFQGIKLTLARYVDTFLRDLYKISNYNKKYIYLDAIGENNIEFFNNLLEHLVVKNLIAIEYVKVRNSPLDILINLYDNSETVWCVVAMILSTRLKYQSKSIELNIDNEPINDAMKLTYDAQENKTSNSIIHKESTLTFGPINEKELGIEFKYLSVFSNGISKSLELSFSPQRALKLHKHILGFRKYFTKN